MTLRLLFLGMACLVAVPLAAQETDQEPQDISELKLRDWKPRSTLVHETRLVESFGMGAKGLKFHKSLGLSIRYRDGRLMRVDDPKLDAIWETCAEYGRPVMLHTADPAAFFTPLDQFNERWHELNEHSNWLF